MSDFLAPHSYFVLSVINDKGKRERRYLHCHTPRSAFLYYSTFKLDLLSGKKTSIKEGDLLNLLSSQTLDQAPESPLVIHLFYELGYLIHGLPFGVNSSDPLALIIDYHDFGITSSLEISQKREDLSLSERMKSTNITLKSFPRYKEYKKAFFELYEHLLAGNCYQGNLTYPFYFSFDPEFSFEEYLSWLWRDEKKIGAYAHATIIPSLAKMYFSNSPECLFQIRPYPLSKNFLLSSYPIKGTISTKEHTWSEAREKLLASTKDDSELVMIADLVRHDLTSVSQRVSEVIKGKGLFQVPGLLHQYAHLQTCVSERTSLYDLCHGLFPGGSITGAPKKRVMELLRLLETSPRSFYCGSTILWHSTLLSASINIRSAEWTIQGEARESREGELIYGAGGGITLQSKVKDEFEEMIGKLKSFQSLF